MLFSVTMFSSNIFADNQAIVTVNQLNDLAVINVESNINVQEYQLIVFGDVKASYLNGFLSGSTQLYRESDKQYRWFNLVTSGTEGSVTLVFEGCITLARINMLDGIGNRINSVGLPQTICDWDK